MMRRWRGYPSVCLPTYPWIYLFACFCQQANCGAMSLQISPFHTIPSIRPLSLSHSTWNSGQDAMGTKKWIPGSRTFWNLPSRSMTHAICCGTTTTPTWKRGAETPTRQAHRATKWEQQHNHDMSHRVLKSVEGCLTIQPESRESGRTLSLQTGVFMG